MADETISTRIVANADFSALIADVHKVTASLSRLQEKLASSNKMLANQIAVMNRSFSDTVRSTGQFSTHFVSLTSDVEKFGKNLDGGKLKLNQYFNAFRDQTKTSGGLIRDLAKQQVALQNAVLQPLGRNAQGLMQFNVHVPRGLDTVKNKTALARTELQIMNKVVQDGAAQVINFGKNTQWTGRQLTVGLTVPLVAFGNAAAKAFREADQELVRLMKVYGGVAGSSAVELGKVRDDVVKTSREISAAMGVSFKETIGLAADIAATGKTGDELLGSIKETTRLSVLGEVDRQEAMKATLAIQSAFKQNTEELSQSINFLNAVENQTSTTLNDLVEAIPKAGPIIQGLGGSIEDLALYMTAMKEGGINASEGANALKSALASLINPTDVAVGKFKTLGIDLLGIVNNNAGNLTGTLMALQESLDTLDPLKKQQAIEQLFGKFQFSRLNALFENLGRQGSQTLQVLDLMKASSEELATVAGRELTAVTESASGKYRRALEGLKASLAEVGEQFLTINTVLINVIDKIVQFAMNLPGPVKQVLALLGGVTAIAGPLIMLTGLLANFFGNMAKGIFHLKAFFKGGEGFKYLTPEMLAAQKAGKLVEESFYSDAKAASVLQQALRNLIDEFSILEAKAKTGAMSVNPAVSTMAGNLVMSAGGGRIVDPAHPLVGPMGSRASSHMVPRSGMSDAQRMQQTMFGMVPGSGPVNQKIGQNPQIYMDQQLPNVPGLTTINGVSTGIVAAEAAKHHAMMATLAMQSKEEIAQMKKQMVATGTVSKDLMLQFDGMLPVVSQLTSSAAQQSAMIVAELRAGTINIEQARARIIQLNLEIERMMAQAVQAQAGSMGRTINPTMIPTLNQPVVDPTGKSNMRELFKKGSTRDFINKVAGALGVRTSGAGYNIETTKPRRMATGGMVYRKRGSEGPEFAPMGTDTVPAMLTPGEFVVKASSVTPETLPILKQMNEGYIRGPEMETVQEPRTTMSPSELKTLDPSFRGSKPSYQVKGTSGLYVGNITDPAIVSKHPNLAKNGMITREMINKALEADVPGKQLPAEVMIAGIAARSTPYRSTTEQFLYELAEQGQITKADARMASNDIHNLYEKAIKNRFIINDKSNPLYGVSNSVLQAKFGHNANLMNLWGQFSSSIGAHTPKGTPGSRRSTTARTLGLTALDGSKVKISKLQGNKSTTMVHASTPSPLLKRISGAGITRSVARALPFMFSRGRIRMANGGMVPNVQYLQEGSEEPVRKSAGMGGMGFMMGGMGLQMAGQSVGGAAGSMMSSAGLAMNFMPMLGMLPKIAAGTNVVSGAFKGLTGMIGRATAAAKMFALSNPYLIAATVAIAGVIAIIKKMRKDSEDTKKEQIALFGVSEKGAKELGIQYVSLTDKLKAVREEQTLAADKARAYFESYTSSGTKGLTLTIQQLRELKERVKADMPETLEILNNIDSSKINDWAANLKAQMISSGKSVEDATNLIYALIESSNKAGMGIAGITSKIFTAIQGQSSAASFITKNLSENFDKVNQIKGEAFAANLDTAVSSVENAIQALIGTKNAQGDVIDQAEALSIVYKEIATSGNGTKKVSQDVLSVIQKQRPELAAILNQSDTIGSMLAKWRVYLSGAAMDLKDVTAQQAIMMAEFQAGLTAAGESALVAGTSISGMSSVANTLKKVNDDQAAAAKKAKQAGDGQLGANKALLKTYQDEIKLIKERADAKKRALRETFDKENAELELQQAKLDLQSAVARGDNEGMASAQIKIQQTQKQISLDAAVAKADADERKETAKQQALYDAEKAKDDTAAKTGTSSTNTATKLGQTSAEITKFANLYTGIAAQKAQVDMMPVGSVERTKGDAAVKLAFSNFMKDLLESANKNKDVAAAFDPLMKKDPKTGKFVEDPGFKLKRSGLQIGGAFGTLNSTAGSMSDFAVSLMGGPEGTLSNVVKTLKEGFKLSSNKPGDKMETLKSTVLGGGRAGAVTVTTVSAAELTQRGISFAKGTVFQSGKDSYEVTSDSPDRSGTVKIKRKAMGGYITRAANGITGMTTSQPYLVGERGPELFVPSSGGQIIPNSILGPSYNIDRGSPNSVQGGVNSSYNNNVYNIDIALNGTNVNVNDIIKTMKAEMALIGAKEGRVRNLGGN